MSPRYVDNEEHHHHFVATHAPHYSHNDGGPDPYPANESTASTRTRFEASRRSAMQHLDIYLDHLDVM